MSESDAVKALGAFPIIQAAVAILVVLTGLWLMRRGERDRKVSEPIPQWLLMGPLHDMMQSVHKIAEQGRQQIDLLDRIEAHLENAARDGQITKAVLETIRNESRLR